MTEKIQNKALLNKWNETTCIHYPQKLSYKLPTTEVEYLRIHKPHAYKLFVKKICKICMFLNFLGSSNT